MAEDYAADYEAEVDADDPGSKSPPLPNSLGGLPPLGPLKSIPPPLSQSQPKQHSNPPVPNPDLKPKAKRPENVLAKSKDNRAYLEAHEITSRSVERPKALSAVTSKQKISSIVP